MSVGIREVATPDKSALATLTQFSGRSQESLLSLARAGKVEYEMIIASRATPQLLNVGTSEI
jgi:hypothetical protein